MKIIKKTSALSVSAMLLMQFTALAPAPAVYAADATKETVIDGMTYVYVPDSPSKNECTVQLIYDDANKQVTKHDTVSIPEKIGNYTVTAIGDDKQGIVISRNEDDVHVETIKLPNTIKEIHKRALVDIDMPYFSTLYVNINDLETVGEDAFGGYTRITDIYAYDKIDKAYYQTNTDLDKFRELVGIDHLKFQEISKTSFDLVLSKSEYDKNKCVNGRLEFINEVSSSPYSRLVAAMYAKEIVKKYGFDDPKLTNLQKMEKIFNYIAMNSRYSTIYTYNADADKRRGMDNLKGTAMSNLGFHSGVCGSKAHAFEALCGAAMGYDIINKDRDILCVGIPAHALNAVRLEHNDKDEGYYLVDVTGDMFMQGVQKGLVDYTAFGDDWNYNGYICGEKGSRHDSDAATRPMKLINDPNIFYKGISCAYIVDDTKGPIHIEMRDKNDKSNKYIDYTSAAPTSPDSYLGQLPYTKQYSIDSGKALYLEPNMYYEISISNSKGEAVFKEEGDHKFKLGDAEYEISFHTRDYGTETPYGAVAPHTAFKNYFEIYIKQLSDDPKPDTYPAVTTIHKTTTTTTTTTTAKPTTTTKKPTTTTTAKPTTTTTKPATTTTVKKETPNLILPKGKEMEYTGSLQELIEAGKASGGTLQYKIGENGEWSEKIPTAAEVGDYTVYYRVVGNEKYYGADTDAEIKGRKNYAFPYCYDCQRNPAHPSKGESCRAYQLKEPLIGDRVFGKNIIKGNWTMEYVSAYKDFESPSKYLIGLVEKTQEADSLSTPDDISIYELKRDGEHNSYGVVIAVSEGENELLYFGDTIKYGGGYILSKEAISDSKTFVIEKDLKEIIVETIKLSGTVNSKIFKTADENILYGDSNCDGNVDLSDAVLIMQTLSNPSKFKLTDQGRINADCYNVGDGVTNADALAIQKYKLSLITELPEKK